MARGFLAAVVLTAGMAAFAPQAMAQFINMPGTSGAGAGGPDARATTVKSSKSNTSDRVGGTQGTGGAAKATNLNSSRSNIYRTGGGGGKGSAAKPTTVKSSKSNTSE
jgi:hypothetical protein